MKIIVYDCEICNEIGTDTGIGWTDYSLMGLSIAVTLQGTVDASGTVSLPYDDRGAYRYWTNARTLVRHLLTADIISGFNISGFDNPLVAALAAIDVQPLQDRTWDPKTVSLMSSGWRPGQRYPKRLHGVGGFRLDDHLLAHFGQHALKTEDGAEAPRMFQRGELRRLYEYCRSDVERESALIVDMTRTGMVRSGLGSFAHEGICL